ncbi:hypothetical protein HA402_011347 [Bradysia odoriphaga]|nr:hypothetical protein HA402_011347 [Bradysia odoriphaga]
MQHDSFNLELFTEKKTLLANLDYWFSMQQHAFTLCKYESRVIGITKIETKYFVYDPYNFNYTVNGGPSCTLSECYDTTQLAEIIQERMERPNQPSCTLMCHLIALSVSSDTPSTTPHERRRVETRKRKVAEDAIPPPQDIISDATPEVMEAVWICESKRTCNEIAKLEASVNNSHAAQNTSDYKHKCSICSQAFKYQLHQRHKFVTHDSKPGENSAEYSPSSGSNILSTIPDTIRNAFHSLETESCPNDLLLTTAIKTEKPEETILGDRSLLVPLYEELINEARDDILPVKCKQEPEEHFEITAVPLSTENRLEISNRRAKKKKF